MYLKNNYDKHLILEIFFIFGGFSVKKLLQRKNNPKLVSYLLYILFSVVFIYFLQLLSISASDYIVHKHFKISFNPLIAKSLLLHFQLIILIVIVSRKHGEFRFLLAYFLNTIFLISSLIHIFINDKPEGIIGIINTFISYFIIYIIQKQNADFRNFINTLDIEHQKLEKTLYYDSLTGLPNRRMIYDQLNSLVNNMRCNSSEFFVAFIDLDNFKHINDLYGHDIGDKLLKIISNKFSTAIGSEDMIGRLSGDEFILIIQRTLTISEKSYYVDQLMKPIFNAPIIVESFKLSITTSIGIASYPNDAKNVNELLKYADIAMYKAKELGKNQIVCFDQTHYESLMHKLSFEQDMISAIYKNELFLVYQPQYTSYNEKLRGYEVLVRWNSPKYGLLYPSKFIPLAEETRKIIDIGGWILYKSCLSLHKLKDHSSIILSINISVMQLLDKSFLETLDIILKQTNVDPRMLEFEVTESIFIKSFDHVIKILNQIKERGIKIALDDFGTGYSSLNYLQVLPIDTLKIDKSFVDRINDEKNALFLGKLIELVHLMSIEIVAEGVETEDQLRYLQNNKCDYIQGFLFGKPMPEEELFANM